MRYTSGGSRMHTRPERWLAVRPGEGRLVVLSALYVACVVGAFLLAKPVRNALFLQQYGPYRLVYVYVAVPAVLSVWLPIYHAVARRLGTRRVVVATLVLFACSAALFWIGFRAGARGLLPAVFYVWVNCFGVVAPVQAWALIGTLFDTRQAKRLLGLIGGGASVGAIAGGAMASTLVRPLGGSVNLLLVLAALVGLAAGCVAGMRRGPPGRSGPLPPRASVGDTLVELARSPYVRRIAALVFVATVVTQWVGFQLSVTASARFGSDADHLTAFFGRFNVALGLAALLVQLVATGPVLRRYGVGVALLALPFALGAGSVAVVLIPGFWSVVGLASLDQGLRFSVDKAGYELLYQPIPAGRRGTIRTAVDVVGNRVADAMGGLVLGLLTQSGVVGTGPAGAVSGTAAASLVLIGVWLWLARRVGRDYVESIRDRVHRHRLETESPTRRPLVLDAAARAEAAARLSSHVPQEVAYALDVLLLDPAGPAPPAVTRLAGHPSADVRRRAVAYLAAVRERGAAAVVDARLQDEDPRVRAEALVYRARVLGLDPVEPDGTRFDVDPTPLRVAMAAYWLREGPAQNVEAARAIVSLVLVDEEVDGAARVAALGDEVVPVLADLLRDPAVALEVRIRVLDALVAVGSARAQAVLVESLLEGDAALRHRVIAALNRLRDRRPDMRVDAGAIELLLLAEILGHYRSYQVLGALGERPPGDPLVAAVTRSMAAEIERIFRLIGLLTRQDDLHSAYVGVRAVDSSVRANAVELLEHAVPPAFRRLVLPLVDPGVTVRERIALADRLVGAPLDSLEQAVATWLAGDQSWVHACVAYAAGALELDGLRADLERWADHPDACVREAARAARRRIDETTGPHPEDDAVSAEVAGVVASGEAGVG